MPRFSLSTAIVATSVLALACAALANATRPVVLGLTVFGTVTALLVATVAIIYRDGPHRAFYVGFALFAWTYLFLVFVAGPMSDLRLDSGLGWLFHELAGEVLGLTAFPDQVAVAHVGHNLIAVAYGVLGGVVLSLLTYHSSPVVFADNPLVHVGFFTFKSYCQSPSSSHARTSLKRRSRTGDLSQPRSASMAI
jgi:hypothetical protein